jgi:hypothetical protein
LAGLNGEGVAQGEAFATTQLPPPPRAIRMAGVSPFLVSRLVGGEVIPFNQPVFIFSYFLSSAVIGRTCSISKIRINQGTVVVCWLERFYFLVNTKTKLRL